LIPREKSLLHTAEFDELSSHVKAVLSGLCGSDKLEGGGALHFGVALRGDLEEFIRAEVEQDEFVAFKKTETVGAGFDGLAPIWSGTSVRRYA